jgi:predicted GTPase
MREENLVKLKENKLEIVARLDDIKESISDMRKSIKEEADENNEALLKAISSFIDDFDEHFGKMSEDIRFLLVNPIFIGVIGKYSHGKSSLINAILKKQTMNPSEADILPMGDNPVTATPTAVIFREGGGMTFRTDSENDLNLEAFRKYAVGATDASCIYIDYGVENDKLLSDFMKQNIRIIDTPGLGGPYFNDARKLKEITDQFSMALVIIKATDITADTANAVKKFLADFLKPILVIVTYWDAWNEADAYEECHDASAAEEKARALINQYFGDLPGFSVVDLANCVTFVSAKQYLDAEEGGLKPVDVSKDYTDFSDAWNIDRLKVNIANFIRDDVSVLTEKRSMSKLVRDKIVSVGKKFDEAERVLGRFENKLADEIEHSRTITENDIIGDVVKDFKNEVKVAWNDTINRFVKDVKSDISEVKNSDADNASENAENFNDNCVSSFDEYFNDALKRKRKNKYEDAKKKLKQTLTKDMRMSSLDVDQKLSNDYRYDETLDGNDYIDKLKIDDFSIWQKINPFRKKKPKDIIRKTIDTWLSRNTKISTYNSKLEKIITDEMYNIDKHFDDLFSEIEGKKDTIDSSYKKVKDLFMEIKKKFQAIKKDID